MKFFGVLFVITSLVCLFLGFMGLKGDIDHDSYIRKWTLYWKASTQSGYKIIGIVYLFLGGLLYFVALAMLI